MRKHSFTIVLILSCLLALLFPTYFTSIGDFSLRKLIIPLLQLIMFGMGATMKWEDFAYVAHHPKAVIVGLLCQFTIMPLLGFGLTRVFDFPAEIAAGVILVGSSPSGLASNVMAYIAKANVALSITITTLATLLAPVLTPLLMQCLAGRLVEIQMLDMMVDILKIVIAPIAVGLLINYFFPKWVEKVKNILPIISMAGITIVVLIMTSSGRDALLTVGLTLLLAVAIHNLGGYLLGYWGGKLFGLSEQDCRTVAIEVGLQNAGLASGLALQMKREVSIGLAAALFAPFMNTSGSVLASWWSKR